MEALMTHASKISPYQRWAQEFQTSVKFDKATRLLKGIPDGLAAAQAGAALDLLVPLESHSRYARFDHATYLRAWAMLPLELERLLREKKADEVLALLKKYSHPVFRARDKLFEAQALTAVKAAAEAGAPPLECTLWGAQILNDSGAPPSALATLDGNLSQPMARTDPEALPCWALRAKILLSMNQYAEALNSIRLANRSALFMDTPLDYTLLTLDPNVLDFGHPENIRLEAILQEKLGRKSDALFCWHWALIAAPNDVKTRENYVRVLLENAESGIAPTPAQPVSPVDLARKARRHAQSLSVEDPGASHPALIKKSYEVLSRLDESNASFYKSEAERPRVP
jgi:hypothetical protein